MTLTSTTAERTGLLRRGLLLEYFMVGGNIVEGLIAVGAGIAARSVALIGFGVDSFVESISGSVLIWRLRAEAGGQANEERIEQDGRSCATRVCSASKATYTARTANDTATRRDAGSS